MQRFFVYTFVNHDTGNPVYIGKGSQNRERQHRFNASQGQDSRLYRWMRKQKLLNGKWPKLFKLEEGLTEQEAFDLETKLVAFYGRADKKTGCLFNHTDGGDGIRGFVYPRKTVEKKAASQRGKKLSPEAIAKRTAAVLGRKNSPETIQKMKKSAKERSPMTPETKEKISKSLKGRNPSLETRAKLSAALKGKPSRNKGHKGYRVSAESRANMSIAAKIRGANPEVRARISAARKGVPTWRKGIPLSTETKARISAALKGRTYTAEQIEHYSIAAKIREAKKKERLQMAA
jgi:hypothetical protein